MKKNELTPKVSSVTEFLSGSRKQNTFLHGQTPSSMCRGNQKLKFNTGLAARMAMLSRSELLDFFNYSAFGFRFRIG
jgi:hypothetical protein